MLTSGAEEADVKVLKCHSLCRRLVDGSKMESIPIVVFTKPFHSLLQKYLSSMDTLLLHNNSKGIMELGALLLSLTGVTKPSGDNPSVLGLTSANSSL